MTGSVFRSNSQKTNSTKKMVGHISKPIRLSCFGRNSRTIFEVREALPSFDLCYAQGQTDQIFRKFLLHRFQAIGLEFKEAGECGQYNLNTNTLMSSTENLPSTMLTKSLGRLLNVLEEPA